MDSVPLLPLELPPASSIINNGTGRGKLSFLRRLALGFGILAVLGLLYVPAYHSAQGPFQGLGEIPIPSPPGGSQSMISVAPLSGWAYNTSRDVRLYIQPNIQTTIISPVGICTSSPVLIIIVCSSILNQKAREAIRDTWASKSNLENVHNSTVQVAFLVGENSNHTLNEGLKNESLQYKDIIQEKFDDTYNNLTLKSVMLLKWTISNCVHTKFVMKTDDDMFVNIPLLVKLLQTKSQLNGVLIGSLICNAEPITDPKNKWYMPKYMFSEAVYPNYLSGTGYVMGWDVVSKLYSTALDTPLIYLEDAYLTGICARRAKLHPTNHPAFSFISRKLDPCIFRSAITAHQVSPPNLRVIWRKLKNISLACTRSSLFKNQGSPTRKGRNIRYYFIHRKPVSKCV